MKAPKPPINPRRAEISALHAERMRKTKAEADRIELELAHRRGELCDKQDLLSRFQTIFAQMKALIVNSSMKDHEKDRLLHAMADLAK